MTPQIDRLGNMSTVLRVSTHIYGVSQEIDVKMFIFRVNLGMWTPQFDHLGKTRPVPEGFNTHLWCFQGHRWETVHFSTKPRHVTPQIDHLGKRALFRGFQHTFMVFPRT